jgi:hypothetical protein
MSTIVSIPDVSLMRRANVEFSAATCIYNLEVPRVKG